VPVGSPLDDNNIAKMKEWGANTVRVLLNENSWSPNECGYAPGYAAAVDQAVQSITSRNMVALLGLHSNARTSCGRSVQQRMADSPGSTTFWTSVADRYKGNPLVAFDLYNEPHDITWDQWLNGGTLTDTDGVRWQATGMRQMYEAVRNTGASNLAVVSGNNWANTAPPPTDQLAGSNVVYGVHAYTCPVNPPPICTAPTPYQAPNNLAGWSSLARDRPVVVTEFGWPNSGSGTYNQSVINWAQAHAVGWTAFGWAPAGPTGPTTPEFGLVSGATPGEPEASGMPVVAALTSGQR
jgi:aryl-phospho-beta-D-glucosidase BglC (GH1 family)